MWPLGEGWVHGISLWAPVQSLAGGACEAETRYLSASLEKGMATTRILAWRIPCTEASGRLHSMGLQSQT